MPARVAHWTAPGDGACPGRLDTVAVRGPGRRERLARAAHAASDARGAGWKFQKLLPTAAASSEPVTQPPQKDGAAAESWAKIIEMEAPLQGFSCLRRGVIL